MKIKRCTLSMIFLATLCACHKEDNAAPAMEIERAPKEDRVVQEKNISVEGSRVHYLESGKPHDPVLLLLHGGRFSSKTWEELGSLQLLAEDGFRVLAVDLPRFGQSPASTVADEEFLSLLLDKLEIESVAIVSPSMSGRFSLPFVARHPERVWGYIPVAPAEIPRFRQELEHSPVPTLVLWGSEDQVFDVSGAAALADRFEQSEIHIFEGASHPCYLDQPLAFHTALKAFIEGISRP